MKKSIMIIMLAIFVGFTNQTNAQNPNQGEKNEVDKPHPKKEKIKAMKIAFITEKLDLTSDEAQKFWPVYNQYDDQKEVIFKEKREMRKAQKEASELSDGEIEQKILTHFELEQKQLDLEKAYYSKFKAVLPVKKVGKLYVAEDAFKRELLRKMKDQRQEGNHHPVHPPKH